MENAVDNIPNRLFFIPGSLIWLNVHMDHYLTAGMQTEVAVAFSRSRAFEVKRLDGMYEGGMVMNVDEAPRPRIDIVAEYATNDLLMSGWAIGAEEYLAGKAAMMNVGLGEGNVVLFGFRPQFRAQSRGTYKLIFNALYAATIDEWPKFVRETVSEE